MKPDYIFVQTSGRPILEASAIACTKEFEVVAVYHEYAAYGEISSESWMMKHVHGLDPDYLQINGFPRSLDLKLHFISWLSTFPDAELFSNSCYTHKIVNRAVSLTNYKGWLERQLLSCHHEAFMLKETNAYINGLRCTTAAHCQYSSWPFHENTIDDYIRKFGYRCTLYECVEQFLYKKNQLDN